MMVSSADFLVVFKGNIHPKPHACSFQFDNNSWHLATCYHRLSWNDRTGQLVMMVKLLVQPARNHHDLHLPAAAHNMRLRLRKARVGLLKMWCCNLRKMHIYIIICIDSEYRIWVVRYYTNSKIPGHVSLYSLMHSEWYMDTEDKAQICKHWISSWVCFQQSFSNIWDFGPKTGCWTLPTLEANGQRTWGVGRGITMLKRKSIHHLKADIDIENI